MSSQPDSRRETAGRESDRPLQSEELLHFARTCEAAGFGQQAGCIVNACALIDASIRPLFTDPWDELLARAQGHAVAGAHESAVLALMPTAAVFTGGRLADGSVVAQVVLGGDAAAHSREARWLAMAWLAALLRAMAHVLDSGGSPAAR